MEKKSFLYFGDFPSEISYLLCFVGGCTGCTDCISFILLFHSLVGFMTVNTLYGVVGFAQNAVSFASLYHLLIVIVFVFFVLFHQIYKQIYSKSKHLQPQKELFHAFFTKCIFYFLFMVSAHILYKLYAVLNVLASSKKSFMKNQLI